VAIRYGTVKTRSRTLYQLEKLANNKNNKWPPYVVDFFSLESRLVMVLDGSQHSEDCERPMSPVLNI